jgi:iron complex outermembrane receptor protein
MTRPASIRPLLLWSTAITLVSAANAQTPDTAPVEPQQPGASATGAVAATPTVVRDDLGDIIVTARKRDETSIAVPVTVTAVGSAELARRAVNNLDGIARIVPQLIIAPQGGSVQGGNISIRGIAGPDSNPFGDQAVSFNIDGVQIAKGMVRRLSNTDIAQVEVLKGPQALFFGKNSPAGIVSIRTADPTDTLEAGLQAGYEFNAREIRAEGYVSAPLTDTLGIRVAGYVSDMSGYLRNRIPEDAYVRPTSNLRTPKMKDYAGRITLKYEPSDAFNARLKLNYNKSKMDGPAAATQYIFCPQGSPQSGSIDDCEPNKSGITPGSGPVVGTLNPLFRDGRNYLDLKQFLGSLEMNYNFSDEVTLTSVTGYYHADLIQAQNYENDYSVALPSTNNLKDKEFSQELRLQTSYDGPLNFTAGAYYSSTRATTGSNTYLFATEASGIPVLAANGLGFVPLRTPFQINQYQLTQKGKAYSAFLQMIYKPVEVIEITVGGRYSYEKKNLPLVQDQPIGKYNPFGFTPLSSADDVPSTVGTRKGDWKDFSPEVTVSYRPTQQLTAFASYKHGFLSGGFNSGSTDFSKDLSYDPQTIKGFEGGVKALLLENTLRVNLAAYTYKVSDMQVQTYRNATNTITNAAASKVKGVEMDFNYRTPLTGFSIHGAAAYNKAKYSSFPGVQCYNGQTNAMGCFVRDPAGNIVPPNPDGTAGAGQATQDLSGTLLPRAPKWSLSGGVNFETPLGDALKLGISADVNYNSSFFTDVTANPFSKMPSYALVDATFRVGDANDAWELALIGRNLTNKHYYVASTDVPFTGGLPGGSVGVLGDRYASVSRGRELMIRASYKFGR